jgi:site-specific DNA-methyltransferase (cytosine-N4-specific)
VTARFLIGDVFDRMAELPDGSFDLIITSPPFLALRSYLPEGHPDKAKEIGSEATPAEFIDTLLALTAEWGRLLAPHGSLAIELGDTYAGSGGAGGDYNADGLREGQARFRQSIDNGWPLPKSLACIPDLYAVALAYGINPLTGQPSPAGQWLLRNKKPWIRSNPPVGALGDKERPATSYVTVACRARDRWFDLDAVRTAVLPHTAKYNGGTRPAYGERGGQGTVKEVAEGAESNPAGAPPRDWWHHVDAILDTELAARAGINSAGGGEPRGGKRRLHGGGEGGEDQHHGGSLTVGAQGVHLRRALEKAGILQTLDALDVSPKGYAGAHYAVWPKELVKLLVDEMCPRRVCTSCGQPSRRITESSTVYLDGTPKEWAEPLRETTAGLGHRNGVARQATTVGWSDCGHGTWRPGRILDPFVGSGTTLEVATPPHDSVGIDIDERNADLALERVGMFLEVDERPVSKESA